MAIQPEETTRRVAAVALLLAVLSVSGCGGGGNGGGNNYNGMSYTVGGTVTGLQGSGLVLTNNGGNSTMVAARATSFTFSTAIMSGNPFSVAVGTQPSNPAQTCTVANGTGVVTGNNITNVAVSCTTNNYTISGAVSGLEGKGLALTDKTGGTVAVTNVGQFSLPNPIPSGTPYAVTVYTAPNNPPQGCSVSNGTGAIAGSNVTNVSVTCNNASQELLVFDGSGNLLYYFIDPATGSLAPSSPTSAALGSSRFGGVTTDKTSTFVYAAFSPSIDAFSVSPTTGELMPIAASPFAVGSLTSALLIDPTGKYLYAGTEGGVYAYARDATTGALTLVTGSPFLGPMEQPFNGAISVFTAASASFLYYPLIGETDVYQLAGFAINTSTGALTSLGALTSGQGGPVGFGAVNVPGSFLFYATGEVQAYSINAATGALTPASIPSSASLTGLLLNSAGTYAYATDGSQVWAYSINNTSGALTPIAGSPFSAGGGVDLITVGAQLMAFDLADKFLYVLNRSANEISAFAVDATTGALTPVAGSPFATSNMPVDLLTTKIP